MYQFRSFDGRGSEREREEKRRKRGGKEGDEHPPPKMESVGIRGLL